MCEPASEPGAARPSLAFVAHELANLVQAVSGNLELIAARTTDETALRYIANARSAAQQLAELTAKLQSKAPPARGNDD